MPTHALITQPLLHYCLCAQQHCRDCSQHPEYGKILCSLHAEFQHVQTSSLCHLCFMLSLSLLLFFWLKNSKAYKFILTKDQATLLNLSLCEVAKSFHILWHFIVLGHVCPTLGVNICALQVRAGAGKLYTGSEYVCALPAAWLGQQAQANCTLVVNTYVHYQPHSWANRGRQTVRW